LADIHIQSRDRNLMYPISPAITDGISVITLTYSPSNLTIQG
jgi:hypothetical protein